MDGVIREFEVPARSYSEKEKSEFIYHFMKSKGWVN